MSSSPSDLESALRKTVLLFNRLNGAEVFSKVVMISTDMVTIAFSGPFCYECGDVQKYVDGFAQDFKVLVNFAELVAGKARETTPHSVQVNYLIKARQGQNCQ